MDVIGDLSPLKAWMIELYEREGKLSPELVREAARPVDSLAHPHVFNVEPEDAAEEYYLERAHNLIRRVQVRIVDTVDEPPRRVRFFHAVPGDETAYTYLTVHDLVRQPDKFKAARTEAQRRLKDAERCLEDLDLIGQIAPTPTPERQRRATKKALASVKQARSALADA